MMNTYRIDYKYIGSSFLPHNHSFYISAGSLGVAVRKAEARIKKEEKEYSNVNKPYIVSVDLVSGEIIS